MCLLTYLPSGRQPDLSALETGAALNPHGHGYALITNPTTDTADDRGGKRLLVVKGLDAEEILERFDHDRRTHPAGPALFHSRWRTHGLTDDANCHPFTLGNDPRTVIAHNGVLPAVVRPGRNDPRSDTRIAAEDYLPALGPLHLRRNRLAVERWMGPDNLMVLLTTNPRYRHPVYLLNETSGLWTDGIWYSNDTYLPPPPPRHLGWTRSWDPWDDARSRPPGMGMLTCASCGDQADPEQEWCPWCGNCWSCAEPPDHCPCWPPAVLHTTPPGIRS